MPFFAKSTVKEPRCYSFLDTVAVFKGPGGGPIQLGVGAGAAEEGIILEFLEDRNVMLIGCDGKAVHNLYPGDAGQATVHLLKNSITNDKLSSLFNYQTLDPRFHGKNILRLNTPSGDLYTCSQVAFVRYPRNAYAKDANTVDWILHIGHIKVNLGGIA